MSFRQVNLCVLTALVTLCLSARSDMVVLRNGRKIEGIVVGEDETAVSVRIGAAVTTLPRNIVLSVQRSAETQNIALTADWEAADFLHPRHVPPTEQALGVQLRSLLGQHEAATAAQGRISSYTPRRSALVGEARVVRDRVMRDRKELERPEVRSDAARFNRALDSYEKGLAGLQKLQASLERLPRQRDADEKSIQQYVEQLQRLAELLTQRDDGVENGVENDARERFFARSRKLVAQLQEELNETYLRVSRVDGTYRVRTKVNDRAVGTFILDTGATHLSMGRGFAERAGVDLESGTPLQVVLADGSKVDAVRSSVSSVAVGDVTVEGLPCIVMPDGPGEGVDGLLGVSCLNAFVFQVDNGGVLLKSFNPRDKVND